MPPTPDNEAFNPAERIRARLPRTLQEEREAAGLSKYSLEKKSSVSREMIACIEDGESVRALARAAAANSKRNRTTS